MGRQISVNPIRDGPAKPEEHLMPHRSAITGRYISNAAAARHPRTSLSTTPAGNTGTTTAHRSAISGRYVTGATAARHPKTTVTENR